ncbi:sensor histidine kinase [Rothia mucilaginosa]|uniref:sensor histidine kinase n=1 Tax=Rothia mucilaginosa TaxID=43675 RepID=UPI001EFA0829|nr:HAMP domain-containing sensor histidine kinase [Rothia mucilaginosa]
MWTPRGRSRSPASCTIQSLSANDQVTLGTLALNSTKSEEREVKLEAGTYLIRITPKASSDSDAQVVGIPLHNVQQTLTIFVIVVSIGSIAVMVGAGVAGSYIIRRTMKPLERVSAVATDVAHLDLEEHTISSAVRVEPRDSDPRTEVGAVGYALNQLLDNVNSALEVRERTEHQIRAFIADASHELRTPLAAIKGYSDMLRWTEPLSDSGQSSLARIDSQTERMSRLVEDLLTLARLDEGREPKLETVDLTELLVECTSDMQAAARTHVWHLDVPHEPVEVVADRSQMQRVILNLLSNARKHTDEGTRVIAGLSVDHIRREAVISVVDNGPGIAPDFLPKIFDRFTRADKARSGSAGTTGLGLAIVQAIVQAHGGSIQVQSQPGHTVFTVRLPLESAES